MIDQDNQVIKLLQPLYVNMVSCITVFIENKFNVHPFIAELLQRTKFRRWGLCRRQEFVRSTWLCLQWRGLQQMFPRRCDSSTYRKPFRCARSNLKVVHGILDLQADMHPSRGHSSKCGHKSFEYSRECFRTLYRPCRSDPLYRWRTRLEYRKGELMSSSCTSPVRSRA